MTGQASTRGVLVVAAGNDTYNMQPSVRHDFARPIRDEILP